MEVDKNDSIDPTLTQYFNKAIQKVAKEPEFTQAGLTKEEEELWESNKESHNQIIGRICTTVQNIVGFDKTKWHHLVIHWAKTYKAILTGKATNSNTTTIEDQERYAMVFKDPEDGELIVAAIKDLGGKITYAPDGYTVVVFPAIEAITQFHEKFTPAVLRTSSFFGIITNDKGDLQTPYIITLSNHTADYNIPCEEVEAYVNNIIDGRLCKIYVNRYGYCCHLMLRAQSESLLTANIKIKNQNFYGRSNTGNPGATGKQITYTSKNGHVNIEGIYAALKLKYPTLVSLIWYSPPNGGTSNTLLAEFRESIGTTDPRRNDIEIGENTLKVETRPARKSINTSPYRKPP